MAYPSKRLLLISLPIVRQHRNRNEREKSTVWRKFYNTVRCNSSLEVITKMVRKWYKNVRENVPWKTYRQVYTRETGRSFASFAIFRPLNGKLESRSSGPGKGTGHSQSHIYFSSFRRREWKSEVVAGTAPRLRAKERKNWLCLAREEREHWKKIRADWELWEISNAEHDGSHGYKGGP